MYARLERFVSHFNKNFLTCDYMVTYNPQMDQDLVFKALADVSRRKLLDLLFLKDGRSLKELAAELENEMTRFGVMKHLKQLEQARLVTTRKQGRETLHYLNAVPIQMVYDRWVSKYSRGWARSLTELKYELEEEDSKQNSEDSSG
jgi:DNA-binding transcriptional ArsR family regulator